MNNILNIIKKELDANNGILSQAFIQDTAAEAECSFVGLGENTTICILRLKSKHEIVGVSQSIRDGENRSNIAKEMAYRNATDQIEGLYYALTKVIGG